jgi:PEP-CTERM putative exosortase interaction domain
LGTLFTASEGSGSIRAITPTGGVSVVTTVSGGAEMLSFVPLNLGSSGNPVEGFYASAFPSNVVTAGASQFAGLLGDLVVTSEFSHAVTDITSGLVQSSLGFFPAQPEDGIFVTAALIRPPAVPEPETWSLLLLGLAMLGLGFRRARYVRGLKAI